MFCQTLHFELCGIAPVHMSNDQRFHRKASAGGAGIRQGWSPGVRLHPAQGLHGSMFGWNLKESSMLGQSGPLRPNRLLTCRGVMGDHSAPRTIIHATKIIAILPGVGWCNHDLGMAAREHLVTPSRSYNMSRIRSRDTAPELAVRSMIHRLGYRFRLHGAALPGKPDIVLARHRKIVFVHGCFWHAHGCRVGGTGPKSNRAYWRPKLVRNQQRDRMHVAVLRRQGWKVLVVWECWTRNPMTLERRLRRFLECPE